jgi:hypothetical protein
LAKLHSKAVDYVKTGDPAIMPRELRAKRRPHFMESHFPKEGNYHSTRALGRIYDRVKSVNFNPLYKRCFDPRVLGSVKPDGWMLDKARQLKALYDTAMRRLMGQREIATEFEIWTGFVLSKPRVGTSYKLQEDIGQESAALQQRFRDMCYEAAGGKSFEQVSPFVVAMYRVTEQEVEIALKRSHDGTAAPGDGATDSTGSDPVPMPLISFPWIFYLVLGRLATGNAQGGLGKGITVEITRQQEASGNQHKMAAIKPGGEKATEYLTYEQMPHRHKTQDMSSSLEWTRSNSRSPTLPESIAAGKATRFDDAANTKADVGNGIFPSESPAPADLHEAVGPLPSDSQPQPPENSRRSAGGLEIAEIEMEINEDNPADRLLKFLGEET